ncbi:LicD family protein [Qipengyuania aurantiaca]|uniref:LicD family protein n=1 Tax=Qipengyuania aurantiaca TaxID=2867233 RepID=A0ABX8ZQJ6_9SPHN|nr:LicD family protein [Qipengyuania aurantiaca]QZD89463.1 LicD family protein [Qipengyuania aurantiaca]
MTAEVSNLEKLHRVQFEILEAFSTFCSAHGLHFCLLAGSALGARRHRAIIPWDDDIDVGMLRADYDRFVELVSHFPDGYYFQDWMQDEYLPAPIAKLRKNGTRMVEMSSKDVGGHKGIFIDIFPLDTVPTSRRELKLFHAQVTFLKRALRHKLSYSTKYLGFPLVLGDIAAKIFAIPLSAQRLKHMLQRVVKRASHSPGNQVIAIAGSYSLQKETLQKRWIRDAKPIAFEGGEFPCPHPIDEYLRHLYGDNFMELPPEQKRKPKHPLKTLEFGQ